MKRENSQKLFRKAVKLIPGGVNSPVRACKSVGSEPLFIDHAEGSRIFDADENGYIDYVGSWGPMILGHGNAGVKKAVADALEKGSSFGAPTVLEITLAEMIVDAVDSIDMVRMVNSGTEATMSAIRLARGVTQRDAIIKFDGCYHGHADSLLVEAGSGVATLAIAGSSGVPEDFIKHTLSLPYNDSVTFKKMMNEHGKRIACVIVEPVAGNMGMVPPVPGFLQTLREETVKAGALLIFDEVMTGFRLAYGGAQSIYGISPDITCLAKVIGGGLPVGAYGGKTEMMSHVAPQGPVYQAGTLSGNPLAMAAGIATLNQLKVPGFYDTLERKSSRLEKGLKDAVGRTSVKARISRVGSMIGLFFTDRSVNNYADAKTSDLNLYAAFYKGMLEQGIYLAPSQFETWFVSMAHSEDDIDQTVEAAYNVLKGIKE
jgi:glutamate-1-semialdehyde 2,1-aminomutase